MIKYVASLLVIGLVLCCHVDASLNTLAQQDLITKLPGLNFPTNYRQFSGYLKPDNSTFLHYWLVELMLD